MEVSAVPSNPNYPEGGDYGNRVPNMSYIATANDPRGDYYSSPPRGQNYDYAQRQYPPDEREYVASHGSCSHCQTHCCQRPTDYQNQPTGSRGERLERYVGTVRNEPAPVAAEAVQVVRSRSSISQGQRVPQHSGPCHSQVDGPPVNEHEGSVHTHPPPNQVVESSNPSYQQPDERATYAHNTPSSCHIPEQKHNNDPHLHQTANAPASSSCSQMESPLINEERNIASAAPTMPPTRSSEPNIAQNDPTPSAPMPSAGQSMPVLGPRNPIHDSVASLMVPSNHSPPKNTDDEGESLRFNPTSLTHLNFKEKQLAMTAVKKAASNMNCVTMFQDKDKHNCGKIGRRDFQIVMDRIGVLRGMSSREIDAIFKGFSGQNDMEIDYKKFSAACKHAIDNDYRLARMAQK